MPTMRGRIDALLTACGYPPLGAAARVRRAGAGAWHDAYRVVLGDGRRLVVRLRKPIIYGRAEVYDERAVRSDYAGVGAYYAAANEAIPGVCPAEYAYHCSPALSGTVESDLGPALRLDALTPAMAFALGERIGFAFRRLHAIRPPWPGWGELVWTPEGVCGEDARSSGAIGLEMAETRREGLARLSAAGVAFDNEAVCAALEAALALRAVPDEPPSLVNRDITPENLIARRGRFVGLIDPVPGIGNGTRHAALFLFCYRSLLPALHDAPRYARHRFDRQVPVMAALADGYESGYLAGGEPGLAAALRHEYFLWMIDEAIACQRQLEREIDAERYLRSGGKEAIARRLGGYVRELEGLAWA